MSKGYSRPVHTLIKGKVERAAIKHLAKGNYEATAKDLLLSEEGKRTILAMVGKEIFQGEIGTITSYMSLSYLRSTELASKCSIFSWDTLWDDLKTFVPMLTSLLQHLTPSQKASQLIPAYCLIIAVLTKARNRRICSLQEVISLVLHAGHTSSEVRNYYTY